MFKLKFRIHPVSGVATALMLFLSLAATPAIAQMRIQVIPFDSVTLSAQQVLLGETQGNPTDWV